MKKIIKEKGYVPEKVFNANEIPSSRKRIPQRMFISKEEKQAQGFVTIQ